MRIIQLISSLGSGGAESVVRDYALGLHEGGNEILNDTKPPSEDGGFDVQCEIFAFGKCEIFATANVR